MHQKKLNGSIMRRRIYLKVDIQEFVDKSNAEYERRRDLFTDAIQNIVKEKNVPYREAKRLLTIKLRFDLMRRELQMV